MVRKQGKNLATFIEGNPTKRPYIEKFDVSEAINILYPLFLIDWLLHYVMNKDSLFDIGNILGPRSVDSKFSILCAYASLFLHNGVLITPKMSIQK